MCFILSALTKFFSNHFSVHKTKLNSITNRSSLWMLISHHETHIHLSSWNFIVIADDFHHTRLNFFDVFGWVRSGLELDLMLNVKLKWDEIHYLKLHVACTSVVSRLKCRQALFSSTSNLTFHEIPNSHLRQRWNAGNRVKASLLRHNCAQHVQVPEENASRGLLNEWGHRELLYFKRKIKFSISKQIKNFYNCATVICDKGASRVCCRRYLRTLQLESDFFQGSFESHRRLSTAAVSYLIELFKMLSRVFRTAAQQGAKNFSTSQPVSGISASNSNFAIFISKSLRNRKKINSANRFTS